MANGTVAGKALRILIIEDELFVADLCKKYLEDEGHSVILAADGQQGIDVYKDNLDTGTAFDLVLTDYRMPNKDGAEVIKEIFEMNPDQKIILATAFGRDYGKVAFPIDRVPILPKPFSFEELYRLVEKQGLAIEKIG